MAFRKLCPIYLSETTHGGFVTVRKIGLELLKIHTDKNKNTHTQAKFNF